MSDTQGAKQVRRQKGPRPKHVPQRMCVVCRERSAKRALTRIVRTPEGQVAVDPTGKMNGRGAYLCDDRACWDKALATGALARALKIEIDAASVEHIKQFAASLPAPEMGAAGSGQEGTVTE